MIYRIKKKKEEELEILIKKWVLKIEEKLIKMINNKK